MTSPKPSVAASLLAPFPIFSAAWVGPHTFVVIGGGGASKTGVPNGVVIYEQQVDGTLVEVRRLEMGSNLPYSGAPLASAGLLAVSVDKEVIIIRLSDAKKLCTVYTTESGPDKDVNLISAFSKDGTYLAVGAEDGKVRVFRLKITDPGDNVNVEVLEKLVTKESAEGIKNLSFHSAGRHVMASCEDGTWRLWAIKGDGLEEQECMVASTGNNAAAVAKGEIRYTCRSCRFSLDGTQLFTIHYVRRGPKGVDRSSYLTRWEVATVGEGESMKIKLTPSKVTAISKFPVLCLALSPCGQIGAAGTAEGQVVFFRTEDLVYKTQERHNFSVTEVSFSDVDVTGSPKILSASGDKTVWVMLVQLPSASLVWYMLLLLIFFILFAAWLYHQRGGLPDSWNNAVGYWLHVVLDSQNHGHVH